MNPMTVREERNTQSDYLIFNKSSISDTEETTDGKKKDTKDLEIKSNNYKEERS